MIHNEALTACLTFRGFAYLAVPTSRFTQLVVLVACEAVVVEVVARVAVARVAILGLPAGARGVHHRLIVQLGVPYNAALR